MRNGPATRLLRVADHWRRRIGRAGVNANASDLEASDAGLTHFFQAAIAPE